MYRVVIIDDEPIIVEGLSKIIDWSKWDCCVTGTAYDGKAGMQLIREVKPHIIITDISMPELNGLNMVAGIKSEFPDAQITILTGYRDFDYAKEAICLGVDRFLLKPSKMDELKEAVDFMCQVLADKGITPDGEEHLTAGEPEDTEEELSALQEDVLYNNAASSFIVKNARRTVKFHIRFRLVYFMLFSHRQICLLMLIFFY